MKVPLGIPGNTLPESGSVSFRGLSIAHPSPCRHIQIPAHTASSRGPDWAEQVKDGFAPPPTFMVYEHFHLLCLLWPLELPCWFQDSYSYTHFPS